MSFKYHKTFTFAATGYNIALLLPLSNKISYLVILKLIYFFSHPSVVARKLILKQSQKPY